MDEPLANSTEEPPASTDAPKRRRLITLACMLIAAGLVAAATPDDSALSKPYVYVSAALGGAYFVAWSVSFWPQVLLNKQRKTTVGLSPDFAVLNAFAFAAYSAYTVSLYASPQIRHQYKRHHDHAPEVRFADVLFCLHALLLSSVTVCVEIKFRAPHAIDATCFPYLRLRDGVAIPRHRRDVVPETASARWRVGSRRSTQYFSDNLTHWLISTQVTVGQIARYDGFATQAPSRPARYGLAALVLYVGGTAVVSHEALQILYALSYCRNQCRDDALPRRWHHPRAVAPTRKQRRRAAPSKSAGGGIQRINTHRQDGRHVL
jgi:hypothetical protein